MNLLLKSGYSKYPFVEKYPYKTFTYRGYSSSYNSSSYSTYLYKDEKATWNNSPYLPATILLNSPNPIPRIISSSTSLIFLKQKKCHLHTK